LRTFFFIGDSSLLTAGGEDEDGTDDFDYGAGTLSRLAAVVEAGYAAPGKAGHVFQEEVDMQTDVAPFNIPI
jgi:hypothetical protein